MMKFTSAEKRAAKLEKELQRAVMANDRPRLLSLFCRTFTLLLVEQKAQLLSDLILLYVHELEDAASLEGNISPAHLKQAISFLADNQLDSAALMLCDFCGYLIEAINLLARRGQANELARRLSQDQVADKALLGTAVTLWEKYNGDIRKDPTLAAVLTNVAKFTPENIPDNPRVREVVGQLKEAASLFIQEGDWRSAADCYQNAEMYREASGIYEQQAEWEKASQAAEAAGDLDRALQLAINAERRLKLAILTHDREKVLFALSEEFQSLLREKKAQLLSDLVLTHVPTLEDGAALEKRITADYLKQAVDFLAENDQDSAALLLCDFCGYRTKAIELLARRRRTDDLVRRLSQDQVYDRALLETAATLWEKYNGDIRNDRAWRDMLSDIAKFAPASIPDNPRAREIVGQFKEAATLYVQKGDWRSAADCYQKAEMYREASTIYEQQGEREKASRAAEAAGDLDRATELAVNPERRLKLLIRLERLVEAREFAAGLETPDEYFDLIKQRARQRMAVRVKAHDYSGALILADIAECAPAEKEAIVSLGRQEFDRRVISADSHDDLKSIYRSRVEFEERAGNFAEAGRLAEEVLGDLARASLLYEKANLFNRAIDTASGQLAEQADRHAATIRLAELHEKGGSLLSAAQLYESAAQYDRAFALYETLQHFAKAVDCYLKTANPGQDVLARLYMGAGEFEKVVEIYMTSGSFPDLEKALSIATTHNLTSHSKVIRDRMAAYTVGNEKDLEHCFAHAKDDVLGSYSSIIGIDFGTTNSVAAIFNKISGKVEIVLSSHGSEYEPSFFGVDDDHHPLFGEAARLRSLTAPNRAVARVKRSLGGTNGFSIDGKQYRCEEIVANLLRQLRSNTEAYVQAKVAEQFHVLVKQKGLVFPAEALQAFLNKQSVCYQVKEVVLSVPAYFNDNQKRATRDSAEIAGLRVRRLLHEPTAAALAYCKQKTYSGTLAVIDLGGGTLDISIVDVGEGIAEVQSIGGDPKLGGSDIDALLVQQVVKNIKDRWGIEINEKTQPLEMARLRDACEALKINLSSAVQSAMELVHFLNRPNYTFTLTRQELEALSTPVLKRMQAAIEATIKEHGSKVDHFLLIGNATRMPRVGELARRTLSAKQLAGIDPGTAVAAGAALEAAIVAGESKQLLLIDIVPYSLGIATIRDKGEEETISRLIAKNATIPITKSEIFSTKQDYQPNVHIRVYQGEAAQPLKNYFLGDFILEVPPAPAHLPQIEVTFDIGADCILTVTALDKATGRTRSIKLEGAVVLSPQEKGSLRDYFAQREMTYSLEKDLAQVRSDISILISAAEATISQAELVIRNFFERFHERVEIDARFYKADPDQVRSIQEMFIQKDQFAHGIPTYRDRLATLLGNLRQTEARHLDFSDNAVVVQLKERIDRLSGYKQSLENLGALIDNDVTKVVASWLQALDSLEPDSAKMSPLEEAKYHLGAGRANRAKEIIESLATSTDGLTEEAFQLLLRCQIVLGLREDYRDTHRRYGGLFGLVHPDFSRLNTYLKAVDESLFMIQGVSAQRSVSGSGFCIAPNLIVTNRHVVEGLSASQIRIVAKHTTLRAEELELDPINDIAVLKVHDPLKPLRLGEFSFMEPGEQVLAIGFPAPTSSVHGENIYISRGIVNSIRKVPASPERVIFIDAKIGGGMSGGPLFNDLGEAAGIVTFVQHETRQNETGTFLVGEQPVALPIHLVKKYTLSIR